LSIASFDPVFSGGGLTRALKVTRSARARRMRLAVDPRDGAVKLILPRRAALAPALAWAEQQREWIEAALAAVPAGQPLAPGTTVPLDGAALTIAWRREASRTVRREGDMLRVGGPEELVPGRVLRWLRAEAARALDSETRVMATRAGVTVGRVRIGDPRSRWGSCSSSGDISYSWRLILMPPAVRTAIVAHEVAHRLHMDHGPDFHAAVGHLFGREPKAERAWLRANGTRLHGIGRVD